MITVRCGGARHNVANIWCDLKCGVEYMERYLKWGAMRDVVDA